MSKKFPQLAVDGLIFKGDKILLVRRRKEPFSGVYALPGGFVRYKETTEQAIRREIKEETGLLTSPLGVFGVYSKPNRDPRGHIISIVYQLEISGGGLRPGSDIEEVKWFKITSLPSLGFDHEQIISDFKEFLSNLSNSS